MNLKSFYVSGPSSKLKITLSPTYADIGSGIWELAIASVSFVDISGLSASPAVITSYVINSEYSIILKICLAFLSIPIVISLFLSKN